MSLSGTYDPSNIFAKILAGNIPCAQVYEDDRVLSFMDAFPQTRGHTLVIPKARSRNLFDTDPEELANLIKKTQMIGRAIETAFSPDGIVITQFNGAPAGQTVFHLHFHILPRYSGDEMAKHTSGQMADMEELNTQAALIQAALYNN
ncbi:MAG: HIT family protein [Hellea sp.]|nr:HIT family protein [Hellea sp.]